MGYQGLHWTRENTPRWDAAKQAMFGPGELAAVGFGPPAPGQPLANEWWRVSDGDGTVVGYGWLDSEWGDAEVTFLVDPGPRGAGIGAFIVDQLAAEAAGRGLNYIYNVVPSSHPDPSWMTGWLLSHGFGSDSGSGHGSGHGDLRRPVRHASPA